MKETNIYLYEALDMLEGCKLSGVVTIEDFARDLQILDTLEISVA